MDRTRQNYVSPELLIKMIAVSNVICGSTEYGAQWGWEDMSL